MLNYLQVKWNAKFILIFVIKLVFKVKRKKAAAAFFFFLHKEGTVQTDDGKNGKKIMKKMKIIINKNKIIILWKNNFINFLLIKNNLYDEKNNVASV